MPKPAKGELTWSAQGREGRPGLPTWAFLLPLGFAVFAIMFYVVIGLTRPEKAAWWGVMGDSAGPFSALFNAGALLAALWAVHLQRIESHESGEATRKQLEAMGQQVAEFARAADAQVALARSQDALAKAQDAANALLERQVETENAALNVQRSAAKAQEALAEAQQVLAQTQITANEIALRGLIGGRETAAATLQAAIANINATIASTWNPSEGTSRAEQSLAPDLRILRELLSKEQRRIQRTKLALKEIDKLNAEEEADA